MCQVIREYLILGLVLSALQRVVSQIYYNTCHMNSWKQSFSIFIHISQLVFKRRTKKLITKWTKTSLHFTRKRWQPKCIWSQISRLHNNPGGTIWCFTYTVRNKVLDLGQTRTLHICHKLYRIKMIAYISQHLYSRCFVYWGHLTVTRTFSFHYSLVSKRR